MNNPVRTNLYTGRCARCGEQVEAETGTLLRSAWGRWVTYHPAHAPTPDPDGTTSDPSALRPNQRDGRCETCGEAVATGTGVVADTVFGGWDVYHRDHVREPAPPPRLPHPGWHRRHLMALDIATTGNRYAVDRILSAAVCTTDGTQRSWLIDPGPGPLTVAPYKGHGITVEQARAKGTPAPEALGELSATLAEYLATKEPLVVWYAPFVLTILETELARHGLPLVSTRLPRGLSPICAPLVLDRHAEPHRSGRRRLQDVAKWYGIHHDDPGYPTSDAETSLVLAQVIAACHPAVGRLSRPALHREQVCWNDRFIQGLEARSPGIVTDRHWPLESVQVSAWTDHDSADSER
ncbi:hypothetical protein ACIRL3_37740 [Streptomyces sp. NPDC102384]|uniref:hypothetical protein n=1 Tax=Streptomyces sp. NPDC102384 TaxID=3366166 RepID=UPI0038046AF4